MPKANPLQSHGSGASGCFTFLLLRVLLLKGGGGTRATPFDVNNRRTLRRPPSGAVPLPPFVSLGSAVVPGQNAAVTFGGGGFGGWVVGGLGPTMFGASGVVSPGEVLSGAEGCGGVVSAGSKSVSRQRKVVGGPVPSGSRHLRQLMAHEESSGLRTSPASLRRMVKSFQKLSACRRKRKIHRTSVELHAQRRLGARSCSVAGRVRCGLLAWNTRGFFLGVRVSFRPDLLLASFPRILRGDFPRGRALLQVLEMVAIR